MLLTMLVFVVTTGAIAIGAYAAVTYVPAVLASRRLDKRLREVSAPADEPQPHHATVVARQLEGPLPAFDRLASRTKPGVRLGALIQQSGCRTTASAIVLMMLGVAAAAGLIALQFAPLWYVAPFAALAGGALPVAFLKYRKMRRLRAFEELFPEALDLLSRALRAGHAFQTSLGMVADEVKDPVGPEFKKTFEQQNYGLPLRDALDQMAERVPILDVRFFVTAVLIQRETGGNLSEILDNLGHVVRERFKIRRQIRVHTAHGRFTAGVLLSLPPLLGVVLMMVNPDHMNLLFTERVGQQVLVVAIVMQVIGFFWIRKVIKIEV
jgi:tight adherence protein B